MYLVLSPVVNNFNAQVENPESLFFSPVFTNDIANVSSLLSSNPHAEHMKVFRLDNLTPVKGIEVTYQEVFDEA